MGVTVIKTTQQNVVINYF